MSSNERVQNMQAFLNDPKVKEKYIARVLAHLKADELIRGGTYWHHGRGCAVGCTIHGWDHKAYETKLGIPEELAHLEDGIFENLSIDDAMKWPVQFLEAIKTGTDLSRVHFRFLAWLLSEETGLLKFTDDNRSAISGVRGLHLRAGNGEAVSAEAWSAARSAARSAAWSAAESEARSAAKSAAWSAARSAAWSAAESAAWSAAESAAWSAAESAAKSAAYQKMSKELLRLLGEAVYLPLTTLRKD